MYIYIYIYTHVSAPLARADLLRSLHEPDCVSRPRGESVVQGLTVSVGPGNIYIYIYIYTYIHTYTYTDTVCVCISLYIDIYIYIYIYIHVGIPTCTPRINPPRAADVGPVEIV